MSCLAVILSVVIHPLYGREHGNRPPGHHSGRVNTHTRRIHVEASTEYEL